MIILISDWLTGAGSYQAVSESRDHSEDGDWRQHQHRQSHRHQVRDHQARGWLPGVGGEGVQQEDQRSTHKRGNYQQLEESYK